MKNRLAVPNLKYLFLSVIVFFFMGLQTYATHIRAADLFATVSATDNRTVTFQLNVYCDIATVDASGTDMVDCGQRLANCATLNFGDGSTDQVHYSSVTPYTNSNTYLFVYTFQHTFPGDQNYTVGYQDDNRNADIVNMGGGSSVNLGFYIAMEINIDEGYNNNHTPRLSVPPIDLAEIYKEFIHNPGAYDIDGDSISYKPYIPQILPGVFCPDYMDPSQVVAGSTTQNGASPAYYSVNSLTGDVTWNAPASLGLFNMAFIIEEWRTFGNSKVRLSYAIRDMQVHVEPGTNNPPVITVPNNVCIIPNRTYKADIGVTDPQKDLTTLMGYGELFDPSIVPQATLTPTTNPTQTPFYKLFEWTPNCYNVRKRPYQVFFNATDQVAAGDPDPDLSDVANYFITVVGPNPAGLRATVDTNSTSTNKIILTWDPYTCPILNTRMQIYRRVGCDTVTSSCPPTGAPNANYALIGTVPIADTSFVDSTAKRGNVYSYALAALLIDDVGLSTFSYPSNNACIGLPLITPIITEVSFQGKNKNSILVAWQKPLVIDTSKVQGPYTYNLYKKILGGNTYTLLHNFPATTIPIDTSFLDTTITPATNYVYFVQFNYFTKGGTPASLTDSSEIASSVNLTTTPITNGVKLTWQATTPWSNSISNLYHLIYRKGIHDTVFVLIDSVKFDQSQTVYTYADYKPYKGNNLSSCDTFSYFVTTAGSYLNILISPQVLYNNSFITTGTIKIDSLPTAPSLQNLVYDCQTFSQLPPYKNVLNWSRSNASPCLMVVGYNVYYSPTDSKNPMSLLQKVDTMANETFTHSGLQSVGGCYTVTALDNLGNESPKSNKVCVNNCTKYDLPNVFTPNGSGENDVFRPIPPSPLFVQSVDFKVYNRYGTKVFERSDDVYLNWDGSGVPDGVYFYTANVTYFSTSETNKPVELKGWIQIIR